MKQFCIYILLVLAVLLGGQVLAQDGSVTVTVTNNANLRTGPGSDYNTLGVIPFNTTVSAMARNEDLSWIQVSFNGQTGWVSFSLVRSETALDTLPVAGAEPVSVVESAPAEAAPPPSGAVTATNAGVLNVRSEPSTSSSRLGQLPPNSTIVPDGRWGSGANAWLRFSFEGQQGWVASWLLTVTGDVNALPDVEAEYNAQAQIRSDAAAQLPQVCTTGAVIPLAAPYTGDASLHPIRLYSANTTNLHPWNNFAAAWTTSDALATQLVACIGEEQRVVIQVCEYYGPNITRYAYTVDVRLIAVQSGQVVASTVLYGSYPRECRNQEAYSLTTLSGGHVQYEQMRDWLQPFVQPQ